MNKFNQLLELPSKTGIKNAHIGGILFGYSQGIRFIFCGIVFYVAAIFINDYQDDPKDTYLAVYIIFMAAMGTGVTISQAPSIAKAKHAGAKIFDIIDEISKIDSRNPEGETKISDGAIELKKVEFKYPSRVN